MDQNINFIAEATAIAAEEVERAVGKFNRGEAILYPNIAYIRGMKSRRIPEKICTNCTAPDRFALRFPEKSWKILAMGKFST